MSEKSWTSEEFEDAVARVYISLNERDYFSYRHKEKNVRREMRLLHSDEAEVWRTLKFGVYVPTASAEVDSYGSAGPYLGYVYAGAPFPESDVLAAIGRVEPVKKFGRLMRPKTFGRHAVLMAVYFPAGEGQPISASVPGTLAGGKFHRWDEKGIKDWMGHIKYDTVRAFESSQNSANSCWRIRHMNERAPIDIGCSREEVKSLLYARTAPMTESGRKRPILHLVQSHRRRMKSGTDVDVSDFIRGSREVSLGGDTFQVIAPSQLEVEARSRGSRIAMPETPPGA